MRALLRPNLLRAKVLLVFGLVVIVAIGASAATALATSSHRNGPDAPSGGVHAAGNTAFVPPFSETQHVQFKASCRIVDTTRAGGAIAANATRNFHVRGTSSLASQGGNAHGCGIPSSATAITAAVTSVGQAGTGYLKAWPFGQSQPQSSVLNFTANRSITLPAVLGLGSGSFPLSVLVRGAASHVLVDVLGYDVPPMQATINTDGTLYSSSGRVKSVTHPSTGVYDVTFDRSVLGCTAVASSDGGQRFAAPDVLEDHVEVQTYDANGNAANTYVNVVVEC